MANTGYVQACNTWGARLDLACTYRGMAGMANTRIWAAYPICAYTRIYRPVYIRAYTVYTGLYTPCMHIPCIYGAYPIYRYIGIWAHTRICTVRNRPVLRGICLYCRACIAYRANTGIPPRDRDNHLTPDMGLAPTYRPRACGRLYTRARA